jgi:hypothetical protein
MNMLEKSTPHDGRERGADNDAHRHVDHIAAKREFLELLQHRRTSLPVTKPTPCHVSAAMLPSRFASRPLAVNS